MGKILLDRFVQFELEQTFIPTGFQSCVKKIIASMGVARHSTTRQKHTVKYLYTCKQFCHNSQQKFKSTNSQFKFKSTHLSTTDCDTR